MSGNKNFLQRAVEAVIWAWREKAPSNNFDDHESYNYAQNIWSKALAIRASTIIAPIAALVGIFWSSSKKEAEQLQAVAPYTHGGAEAEWGFKNEKRPEQQTERTVTTPVVEVPDPSLLRKVTPNNGIDNLQQKPDAKSWAEQFIPKEEQERLQRFRRGTGQEPQPEINPGTGRPR